MLSGNGGIVSPGILRTLEESQRTVHTKVLGTRDGSRKEEVIIDGTPAH